MRKVFTALRTMARFGLHPLVLLHPSIQIFCNKLQLLSRMKRKVSATVKLLHQCWTSLASYAGVASKKILAKTHSCTLTGSFQGTLN